VIPVGGVEEWAFEVLNPFVVGKFPSIEVSNSVNDNIYLFFVGLE
jgi:hypothetical protein